VRYADEQIGRLVRTLRRLGIERRTILVVTSDHGEEFGEHGDWGHARTVYDEVLHVPVVVSAPGRVPAGRRIATPVSLVDLPPTLLALAGVPVPPDLDGVSQMPQLTGDAAAPDRAVFAVTGATAARPAQIAARLRSTKWILTESTPPVLAAYDLIADPGEQRPLEDPALLEQGRILIAQYRTLGAKAAASVEVPIGDATRRRLEALGYTD
jgi:arylsulfatase A-like enzyme